MWRVGSIATVAALACLSSPPAAALAAGDPRPSCGCVPPQLRLAPVLRRPLAGLCQASPTVRRQLRRIESADISIDMGICYGRCPNGWGGFTTFEREQGRLRRVTVLVEPDARPELVAHELEHVIEQLDGISILAGAAGGVRELHSGAFETERAIRVGRQAAAEVAAAGRPASTCGRSES